MMKSRKKEFKRKYFGSLTHQLILISICLVTGTLLLCWFINTVFLEPYYVINKQNTLLSGFETIDEASEAGTLDDSSFDVTFDNLCANGNITVMIISSDRTIVRSSVNDTQKMMLEFMNIIFGEKQNEVTVMMQSDNYIIQKQTDTRLDSEFLVLYGTLSNGNLILMRTALESIRESVNLSNTFLACVGVVAAIISAVVIVFVSRGITTPLLRLTDISKRMTELDFEAKYQPGRRYHNEVDELGEYMNVMSTTLEHTISELKSANNQLQIDIDKKTQIDEMRKEFLSNVSHELKTPLTAISGYAELIENHMVDPAQETHFAKEIQQNANRLLSLINDIIRLSELDNSENLIHYEQVDLNAIAQECVSNLTVNAEKRGIQLFYEGETCELRADRGMLLELVDNLTANAIRYNNEGGEVHVKVLHENMQPVLIVSDNGIGIPKDQQERIFERFYRVDKSRSKQTGGTGLGLAIVKHIVELHDAQIMVESEPGKGTTMKVTF